MVLALSVYAWRLLKIVPVLAGALLCIYLYMFTLFKVGIIHNKNLVTYINNEVV